MPVVTIAELRRFVDKVVAWVAAYFGDCVYSLKDQLSFFIGLSSIACWLVAQAP